MKRKSRLAIGIKMQNQQENQLKNVLSLRTRALDMNRQGRMEREDKHISVVKIIIFLKQK